MNLSNLEIADLWLGGVQAKSAYLGGTLVWSDSASPLCFTAEEANSTVKLSKVGAPGAISLEYSYDGNIWTDYTWPDNTGDTLTLSNVGDKVYMRAKNDNTTINSGTMSYYNFFMTGKVAASGNIQTLLKADGSADSVASYAYFNLFSGCSSLTEAPELPAKTLSNDCYRYMFYGCTSLSSVPVKLPAKTLAAACYSSMFESCTSLTQVPALPSKALADSCYSGMFKGCTSLTDAPDISDVELANNCCYSMFENCTALSAAPGSIGTAEAPYLCCIAMFKGCTSLAKAPFLPATVVGNNAYGWMFENCTSLSSVSVGFSSWPSGGTPSWLNNVAASGTFTCPEDLPDTRGSSNIPTGWTKTDNTPLTFTAEQANSTVKLNKTGSPDAVSLVYSYDGSTWNDYTWSGTTGTSLTLSNIGDKVYMRAKNENLTFSKNINNYYTFAMTGKVAASGNILTVLNASGTKIDAPSYCYTNMFSGCSSLTTAPSLPATTLADHCYLDMFCSCSSLTTAPSLPATTLANYCYYYMFSGCTSLTSAPALPATTLANYCYSNMFLNCTSLTTAPSLPVTMLPIRCYQSMFSNCTSLNSVEVGFTTWTSYTTEGWLNNVAASGTFTCPAELPDTRGASNIPSGWTKVDAA